MSQQTKFTAEDNKKVIAEYFEEYWGKGNADIVDKLCVPDYLIHYPMHGPVVSDRSPPNRADRAEGPGGVQEDAQRLPSVVPRPDVLGCRATYRGEYTRG